MKNFQISQGNNGAYSHQLANALDLCGKDTGIEDVIAPCDMKWVGYDTPQNGNAVWFQSVEPVLFADGTVNYATFMFIHCNDISHIIRNGANYIYKQGVKVISEGTSGMATGNHSHCEVAKGTFSGFYAKNTAGVWTLPNSIASDKAFIKDGTNLINNGQPVSSGNRMNWINAAQIIGTSGGTSTAVCPAGANYTQDATVNVGDTVSSISCSVMMYDPTSKAFAIPEFGGVFISQNWVSEAPDTGDGACDNYIANTSSRIYLDPCKVEEIDIKGNRIKVHGNLWLPADPICVKK